MFGNIFFFFKHKLIAKKNVVFLFDIFLSFQTFQAPSFDDKILEVVAVFGGMQMAVSRVLDIQHHRIAQVFI